MNHKVIVGLQWGDEGKGKWVDILAKDADIIVRFQGGNNAGHTVMINEEIFVLHHLPSGILHEGKVVVLATGMVINPLQLLEEMTSLSHKTSIAPERLWISPRTHVITPWHCQCDQNLEARREDAIGTTKKGIGPTYSDRALRHGLRFGDYIHPKKRQRWVDTMIRLHPGFSEHLEKQKDLWNRFHQIAETFPPYVIDAEERLRSSLKDKRIFFEGAQGSLLDLDHGTYPYVTASSTLAGAIYTNIAIKPQTDIDVLGIAKAYLTRVGHGPFPTELQDKNGRWLAEKGKEFGATTGRARRCGWLDLLALKYAIGINGVTQLILNKLDVLSDMPMIQVATHYKHHRLGMIKTFPWDQNVLEECEPVYQTLPGWKTDELPKTGSFDELPQSLKNFLKIITDYVNVPVKMLGTGPKRQDAWFDKQL